MKRCVWIIMAAGLPLLAKAQAYETQQLLMDVQKLAQLKQMLADLKQGYEIVYSGYSAIKDISQGNFNLHEAFLDGLLQVSPAVRNYKKVGDIISLQLRILSEYKSAFARFREGGRFTPAEIDYMGKVYSHLFDESANNLQSLTMILTPGTLRMSDDERLQQIDDLHEDMADKLSFLRRFNTQAYILEQQRTKEDREINLDKAIFGLKN